MTMRASFTDVIQKICGEDSRYEFDAYLFIREALDVTSKMLDKPQNGPDRHVSGRELLDGIRMYALQEFGPMTRTVLESWGVRSTADFGEIVFKMVENGVLGKTDTDTKNDFTGGYDFFDAFVAPFLPESVKQADKATVRRRPAARNQGGEGKKKKGDDT